MHLSKCYEKTRNSYKFLFVFHGQQNSPSLNSNGSQFFFNVLFLLCFFWVRDSMRVEPCDRRLSTWTFSSFSHSLQFFIIYFIDCIKFWRVWWTRNELKAIFLDHSNILILSNSFLMFCFFLPFSSFVDVSTCLRFDIDSSTIRPLRWNCLLTWKKNEKLQLDTFSSCKRYLWTPGQCHLHKN